MGCKMEIRTVKHIYVNDIPDEMQKHLFVFMNFFYGEDENNEEDSRFAYLWCFTPEAELDFLYDEDFDSEEDAEKWVEELELMVKTHHTPFSNFLKENGITDDDEVWLELKPSD